MNITFKDFGKSKEIGLGTVWGETVGQIEEEKNRSWEERTDDKITAGPDIANKFKFKLVKNYLPKQELQFPLKPEIVQY